MSKRNPLKLLGLILLGAAGSFSLLSGGNAHAFSLSPEDIIKMFMNAIVRYVANDAMETYEETVDDLEKTLGDLYGDDSDDVAKTITSEGVGVNKAISVEELIYNQKAMSDAQDIRTSCRKSTGPVIEDAKKRLDAANEDMQTNAPRSSIEQIKRQVFEQRAASIVGALRNSPDKIPQSLDGANFAKDEGYIDATEAKNALDYIKSLTEHKRSTIISHSVQLNELNPSYNEELDNDIGRMGDVMIATAVLNDIYLSRVRDKGLAQSVIERTTDGEASILKIHANESGMSLIDVYNYEAEIAAFNPEYVKDIITAKLDDNQDNESVIPSSVRGYKYIVQMKAQENAFRVRLYEQEAAMLKLNAVLTKQILRARING